MKDRTDEQLMRELAAGNHAAFEELLSRYERAMLTFCYSFTRNREAAEDLAQETFLRVFRHAGSYQPLAKFTTWLYKIAANLCINEIKKVKLRPKVSLDEPAGPNPEGTKLIEKIASATEAPLGAAERSEIQELLRVAIEHLPDDQRQTLVLVEHQHLNYADAAEILGVSVSAVKMRVKRARETLRTSLRILRSEAEA